MKCVICKNGETKPGKATITLNRGETSLVFKEVPAEICDNCGEPYTDQEVTEKLQESARQAERDGAGRSFAATSPKTVAQQAS